MRIVCFSNTGQRSLLMNLLNSLKKVGIPLEMVDAYYLDDGCPSADYQTDKFAVYTRAKMVCVLDALTRDPEVLWVDSDIVFFDNCLEHIKTYMGDITIQDDLWSPCCGFFLARRTEPTLALLRIIIDKMATPTTHEGRKFDDQSWFNTLYPLVPIIVNKLPIVFYPNGQVYYTNKNRSLARIWHNNCVIGAENKIARFKELALWNPEEVDIKFIPYK